jgi:hypothetical protein
MRDPAQDVVAVPFLGQHPRQPASLVCDQVGQLVEVAELRSGRLADQVRPRLDRVGDHAVEGEVGVRGRVPVLVLQVPKTLSSQVKRHVGIRG